MAMKKCLHCYHLHQGLCSSCTNCSSKKVPKPKHLAHAYILMTPEAASTAEQLAGGLAMILKAFSSPAAPSYVQEPQLQGKRRPMWWTAYSVN